MTTLQQVIKSRRRRHEISQTLGISETQLIRIADGHVMPAPWIIHTLATTLQCPIEDITPI